MHKWKLTIYDTRTEQARVVAAGTLIGTRETINEVVEAMRDSVPPGHSISFEQVAYIPPTPRSQELA